MDSRLPKEFTERMKQDLKDEADLFFGSFLNEARRGIRLNPKKYDQSAPDILPKELSGIPWEKNGYYYKDDPDFAPGKNPLHQAGAYYIQEPSAMAPVNYLDVHPGMSVLDLCAAPGGKSTQIAALLDNKGILVSNEIISDRARILSQNIERLGITNCLVTSHEPSFLAERYPAAFDRILVDAPCSGEGMFRRDQTAVDEWSEENVDRCVRRQQEILDAAAIMLKPGGRMVYSTCTFGKEENEGQTERFLERHGDFHPVMAEPFTGMRKGSLEGTLRIWPQDGYGEGHFMAVLERDGEDPETSYGYRGAMEPCLSGRVSQGLLPYREFVSEIFNNGNMKTSLLNEKRLFMSGRNLCMIPEDGLPLLAKLKYLRAGLELGEIKKDRFVPSHALALAASGADAAIIVELSFDGDEAAKYLAGESLDMRNSPFREAKGWCIVTTAGITLGWGKITGGIMKNHYPKGLRIRK